MAMNRVQFQPGLSRPALLASYGSEGQCERALEAARWPRWLRLSALCGQALQQVPASRAGLLAVFALSPAEQSALGNGV